MKPKTIDQHIKIVRLTQHVAEYSNEPNVPPALRLNIPTAFAVLLNSALALVDEVERLRKPVAVGVRECKHGFAIQKDGTHHCTQCPPSPPLTQEPEHWEPGMCPCMEAQYVRQVWICKKCRKPITELSMR